MDCQPCHVLGSGHTRYLLLCWTWCRCELRLWWLLPTGTFRVSFSLPWAGRNLVFGLWAQTCVWTRFLILIYQVGGYLHIYGGGIGTTPFRQKLESVNWFLLLHLFFFYGALGDVMTASIDSWTDNPNTTWWSMWSDFIASILCTTILFAKYSSS